MKIVVPGGGVLGEDVGTLEVGPEAVVLRLDVGEREVPRRLTLALESTDEGAAEIEGLSWSTSVGPLVGVKVVEWLLTQWPERRPVCKVGVSVAKTSFRVWIIDGGGWIPIGVFSSSGNFVYLPATWCTGVRLEVVTFKKNVPVVGEAEVSGCSMWYSAQVHDLGVRASSGGELFYAGPLGEEATVVFDKLDRDTELTLTAKGRASVKVKVTSETDVLQVFLEDAPAVLQLDWPPGADAHALAEASWELPPLGGKLLSLSVDVDADLVPEELLFCNLSDDEPVIAQLCDQRHVAAVCLELPNPVVTGLDVRLRAPEPAWGRMYIYADDHGRPALTPLGDLELKWTVPGDNQWHLCRCQLAEPVRLEVERWWLMVVAEKGSAHWAAVARQRGGKAMARVDEGPWKPAGIFQHRVRGGILENEVRDELVISLTMDEGEKVPLSSKERGGWQWQPNGDQETGVGRTVQVQSIRAGETTISCVQLISGGTP